MTSANPALGYFVTGTDTDAGKTVVTAALLTGLAAQGLRTVGMKPVASGSRLLADGRIENGDVLAHARFSSVKASSDLVNPYTFVPPVSPHLAASMAGVRVSLAHIRACYDQLLGLADLVLVEGAGGWLAPLDERHTMADLAEHLKIPVLLVVGIRLGCLNHAMLTVQAIRQKGLLLAGWVANFLDPGMLLPQENLDYLTTRIDAPLLGRIDPFDPASFPEYCPALTDFRPDCLLSPSLRLSQ